MKFTFTYVLLLCVILIGKIKAQEVSTLVNRADMNFEAIHWHEDGRIYSVDFPNGRLYQVFLDGTVETLVTGISNPVGGGFGEDGSFYYSTLFSGTIYQYKTDGTVTRIAGNLAQPTSILQSTSSDVLFVGEYAGNSVVKISKSTGTRTSFAQGNGINGPDAVIFDDDGNIIVANYNDNKVHKVNALTGTVTHFATLPSTGLMGYITKAGDDFYVPSIAGRKIYKISKDGAVEFFAGSGSAGHRNGGSLDASFTEPNGIVSNPTADTILVTDGSRIRMITNFGGGISNTQQIEGVDNILVSPNPTSDVINLSFELQTASPIHLELFNQTGQLVKQNTIQNLVTGQHSIQVPIHTLPNGIYSLKISDEKNYIVKQIILNAQNK